MFSNIEKQHYIWFVGGGAYTFSILKTKPIIERLESTEDIKEKRKTRSELYYAPISYIMAYYFPVFSTWIFNIVKRFSPLKCGYPVEHYLRAME